MNKLRREGLEETKSADILILTSSIQKCQKIKVCCLSYPVCVILLWQSEQTNPEGFFHSVAIAKLVRNYLTMV